MPPNEITEPAPSCVTTPAVPLMPLVTVVVPLVKSNNKVPVSVTAPVPKEPVEPALPTCNVPEVMVVVPYVLAPANIRLEAPFSVTFVMLEPMLVLISSLPPLPLLVRVPVLLMGDPDSVTLFGVALLFCKVKLPVPVAPPETVSKAAPLLSIKVVPPAATSNAPLTVNGEVALLSVMPVTLPLAPEPTLLLMVVVPVLVPVLVIVPALLMTPVEKVSVPAEVALLLMVKLLLPVTPPLKVGETAPVLPIVRVPVVVPRVMAFAKVSELPPSKVAAVLPPVAPNVTPAEPNALADVVPSSVPELMVVPPEYVFTPERSKVPVPD